MQSNRACRLRTGSRAALAGPSYGYWLGLKILHCISTILIGLEVASCGRHLIMVAPRVRRRADARTGSGPLPTIFAVQISRVVDSAACAGHDHVRPKPEWNDHALVADRQRHLPAGGNPDQAQFQFQAREIDRLQKTDAQGTMNLDPRPDDLL